jgi:hypothetical protein
MKALKERLNRLAHVLGMVPGPRMRLERSDGRWWLCGARGGDVPLPQTGKCHTMASALDAAEAWLAPEIDRMEARVEVTAKIDAIVTTARERMPAGRAGLNPTETDWMEVDELAEYQELQLQLVALQDPKHVVQERLKLKRAGRLAALTGESLTCDFFMGIEADGQER